MQIMEHSQGVWLHALWKNKFKLKQHSKDWYNLWNYALYEVKLCYNCRDWIL